MIVMLAICSNWPLPLQVDQNRWKLDINSHQDGILMLSAVNLPGGAQVGDRSLALCTA